MEDKHTFNELEMPNGDIHFMDELAGDYIFLCVFPMVKNYLKRKVYDVGLKEQLFYEVSTNMAKLFYKVDNPQYRKSAYDILCYIYKDKNHSKYLEQVNHPAKRASKAEP